MRAVVQRVSRASVTVDAEVTGQIGFGLLVYLGIGPHDGDAEVKWLTKKVAELRIFPDDQGRFDRSVEDRSVEDRSVEDRSVEDRSVDDSGEGTPEDATGSVLVVSQFTLYADTREGRRPAFTDAAPPEVAAPLVERVMDAFRARGLTVAGGRFGAHMLVEAVNDGPVTIILDSNDRDRPRRS